MASRHAPSDTFTRFTSTQPHAMTRPTASTTSFNASRLTTDPRPPPSSTAGPAGETPSEKVARLRAANRLAKERGNASGVDRLLHHGRRWADNMHRFTTYALIAFTGVSTVVAVYGVTSLVAHNRRQKRAWIEREMNRLGEAQAAFLRGEATAEQLHLLEQERAGEEMALQHKRAVEAKKAESYWSRMKGILGQTAAKGEMGTETESQRVAREARLQAKARQSAVADGSYVEGEVVPVSAAVARPVASSGIKGVGVDSKGRPVPQDRVEYLSSQVEQETRSGEKEVVARTGVTGGQLDVLAGNVVEAAKGGEKGWWSWATGR
ncbi:hypothetical protein LTR84_006765 [Exophiala bonariae]|uniref:Cytochrome oxidase c assembly-domain-containing protein n=1 Tax=Exophiala bonariae TaxID=1690606 RepID=A0AAV9MZV2_9EURO|nr:hypothetical protein LTR84_006765 [Exophiala bonariae]